MNHSRNVEKGKSNIAPVFKKSLYKFLLCTILYKMYFTLETLKKDISNRAPKSRHLQYKTKARRGFTRM